MTDDYVHLRVLVDGQFVAACGAGEDAQSTTAPHRVTCPACENKIRRGRLVRSLA